MPQSSTDQRESIDIIHESIVDLWESIPTQWPQLKYERDLVDDLAKQFREYRDTTGIDTRKILDCGCGTGNPSIGLAQRGFQIVAVDRCPKMIERFNTNCRDAGVKIPTYERDWRDLASLAQQRGPFDVVMCRGNSLIYVDSWECQRFSPEAARTGIAHSLSSMVDVLKPGGILYVDMPSETELISGSRHIQLLGKREADGAIIVGYWIPQYDWERRIRRLEVTRVEHDPMSLRPNRVRHYSFHGYLLQPAELKELMETAGCSRADLKQIKGERLYESYWGYKKFGLKG